MLDQYIGESLIGSAQMHETMLEYIKTDHNRQRWWRHSTLKHTCPEAFEAV